MVVDMSTRYRENNFSTESSSFSLTKDLKDIQTVAKPNIDNLIKRIHTERRRETKKNAVSFGVVVLSIILIFIFSQK
jgi:hypothetical protein